MKTYYSKYEVLRWEKGEGQKLVEGQEGTRSRGQRTPAVLCAPHPAGQLPWATVPPGVIHVPEEPVGTRGALASLMWFLG